VAASQSLWAIHFFESVQVVVGGRMAYSELEDGTGGSSRDSFFADVLKEFLQVWC
jgi:hypothetical protein